MTTHSLEATRLPRHTQQGPEPQRETRPKQDKTENNDSMMLTRRGTQALMWVRQRLRIRPPAPVLLLHVVRPLEKRRRWREMVHALRVARKVPGRPIWRGVTRGARRPACEEGWWRSTKWMLLLGMGNVV